MYWAVCVFFFIGKGCFFVRNFSSFIPIYTFPSLSAEFTVISYMILFCKQLPCKGLVCLAPGMFDLCVDFLASYVIFFLCASGVDFYCGFVECL